jgi:hypothetical protein
MQTDRFRYPFRGDDAPLRLAAAVGAALGGVTTVFLWGYAVAVARATIQDETLPPAVDPDDWQAYGRDGLFVLALVLGYGVVPAALLGIGRALDGGAGTAMTAAGVLTAGVAALCLPAGVIRFAHRGTLRQGVALWTLVDIVTMPAYLVTWAIVALLAVVPVGVATAVPLPVAWLVTAVASASLAIYGAHEHAVTYRRIMGLDEDRTTATGAATA